MSENRNDITIYPSIQQGVRKEWRGLQDGTKEWWRDFRRFIDEPPVPGRATLEPAMVKAGNRTVLKLRFEVGEGGIGAYGHIAVECPLEGLEVYIPGKRYRARVPVISAQCSTSPAELDVGFYAGIIDVMNRVYALEEGEVVEILLGDPRESPAVMPRYVQAYPFAVALDRDNTGLYSRIAEFPALRVTGGARRGYHLAAPPLQQAGKPFGLRILAVDGAGNPAADGFEAGDGYGAEAGSIAFTCSDPSAELKVRSGTGPANRDKGGSGHGTGKAVSRIQVTLNRPGVHHVTVCDQALGVSGLSNPILVQEGISADEGIPDQDHPAEGFNLFFGDIHGHNAHCDGRGTADEYYTWARDVRLLDFSALTNHVEEAKRYRIEDFWPVVGQKAAEYYEPGRFVTFLAFEWGSWERFGDKCVYYEGGKGRWFGAHLESASTPDRLWRELRGKAAITIPHHSKYGGKTDWSFHDPELQPVAEIYSTWGSSEQGGEHSVQSAWARGYKLGVIASSDTHTGTPGNEGGGLAAVWAGELTREGLFRALRKRRCYATTGARILLDFRLNGFRMGEAVREEQPGRRELTVLAAGTGNLDSLEILKNNEVVHSRAGSGKVIRLRWEDGPNRRSIPGEDFYYVRVSQTDGNRAWSSPIWIGCAET
jgi:hypothetical protein